MTKGKVPPVQYVHLKLETAPPEIVGTPHRLIIIADAVVSAKWRYAIAKWISSTGCGYVLAWGKDCEDWHDDVDSALLEAFDYDVPEEQRIMTTWHTNETLPEVMWFAQKCTSHPVLELNGTILLHISNDQNEDELLQVFSTSIERNGNGFSPSRE